MAAKLKKVYGADTKLTSGGRGEFTLWVDGVKAFDKDHGDFPTDAQAVAAVEAVVGKGGGGAK